MILNDLRVSKTLQRKMAGSSTESDIDLVKITPSDHLSKNALEQLVFNRKLFEETVEGKSRGAHGLVISAKTNPSKLRKVEKWGVAAKLHTIKAAPAAHRETFASRVGSALSYDSAAAGDFFISRSEGGELPVNTSITTGALNLSLIHI